MFYIDLIDFICKAPEAFPYCRNFHLCIVNVYVLCFNMEWSYFITQLFLHCRLYNIHKIRSWKTNKKTFIAQNAYNAFNKWQKASNEFWEETAVRGLRKKGRVDNLFSSAWWVKSPLKHRRFIQEDWHKSIHLHIKL